MFYDIFGFEIDDGGVIGFCYVQLFGQVVDCDYLVGVEKDCVVDCYLVDRFVVLDCDCVGWFDVVLCGILLICWEDVVQEQ